MEVLDIREEQAGLLIEGRALSQRQRAILRFVQEYYQQQGRSPSIEEIGEAVGLRSTSNVHYHVNRLVEQGYLGKQAGSKRTLVVLDTGLQRIREPDFANLEADLAALRLENRRLRAWCRQLERERAWEREQRAFAQAG